MDSARINRCINILLRTHPEATIFPDGERLETYRDGRFKISKLTTTWGPTLFCITQDGKDVYLDGDTPQVKCLQGEWHQWLLDKSQEAEAHH